MERQAPFELNHRLYCLVTDCTGNYFCKVTRSCQRRMDTLAGGRHQVCRVAEQRLVALEVPIVGALRQCTDGQNRMGRL